MASNVVDLRPVLASLSRHSVSDVRVRKCKETNKIFLRFKVYGPFAPLVFDECRVRLALTGVEIAGIIRVVKSVMVRNMEYFYEFQADDPSQISALHFSEGRAIWSNVLGVHFVLCGKEHFEPNPFFRAD